MRSPTVSNGSGTARIGTRKLTATALVKTTNGAARKSHDALSETTTSLAKSLRSSRYGCQHGAPRRFWSRAFSQRMRPTTPGASSRASAVRSEEHTSELQSRSDLVCRLLLEKKKKKKKKNKIEEDRKA